MTPPPAQLLGMPLLIVSLGSEMLYILHQRLQAQSIDADKATRVLKEVCNTMLSAPFIDELCVPQHLYGHRAVRAVFDRLAHSSICRLNPVSMGKLFDLMTMSWKRQLLSMPACGAALLQSTHNHLDALAAMLSAGAAAAATAACPPTRAGGSDSSALDRIAAVRARMTGLYGDLSPGDAQRLRQSLLRFVQDRKVKVSVFLTAGTQLPSGSFVVDVAGGVLPPHIEPPGRLTTYATAAASPPNVLLGPLHQSSQHLAALALPRAQLYSSTAMVALCAALTENVYDKRSRAAAGALPASASSPAAHGAIVGVPQLPTVGAGGGGAADSLVPSDRDSDDSDGEPEVGGSHPKGSAHGAAAAPQSATAAKRTRGLAALDLLSSLLGVAAAAGGGGAAVPGGSARDGKPPAAAQPDDGFRLQLFLDPGLLGEGDDPTEYASQGAVGVAVAPSSSGGGGPAPGGPATADSSHVLARAEDRLSAMAQRLGLGDGLPDGGKQGLPVVAAPQGRGAAEASGGATPGEDAGGGNDLLSLLDELGQ